jgi:hypothetical protein
VKYTSTIDCSDLYDNAAERLKKLDSDIDKTIQDLAKEVEARGVPKNKVARQVVKELTAREVLSKSRIYEGLGTEQKRKYKKREIEETFPQVEITPRESSTNQQAIQAVATRTGRSETLKDMNGRLNIKLVSEEQKQTGAPRQENKSLKENERLNEKEKSELIKEIADLRKEYARLKSKYQEHERQLAEKTEQISELRKDSLQKDSLQKDRRLEFLREIQEKFYDEPGMLDAKQLQKISEKAGRDLETYVHRYNTIILGAVELGQPVPLGLYIIIKPNKVLVPIRLEIDFDKRKIEISLWEKKLEIPPPSVPVSSYASKVRF